MAQERIQKFIAESGVLSRRKAEEAIVQGRVAVNGKIVSTLGTKVDPEVDKVSLDGKRILLRKEKTILIFHKPRRVVTTKSDPEGRRTVMDYLPEKFKHLKPVGRLDFDSEGLLLFTDDGEVANRLMHPRYGIRKTYLAWVTTVPSDGALKMLVRGVALEDGMGRFEAIEREQACRTCLRIVVSEGRNRFVRRMLDAVGTPVVRLKRTGVGSLELGSLLAGQWRELQPVEVKQLLNQAAGR